MTGADIVKAARAYTKQGDQKAVRYKHQGRNREGMDCIGLTVCVRQDLGLPQLDAHGYAKKSDSTEMLDFCRANLIEVARTDLQPGDLLVQLNGNLRHMAIVGDYVFGGLSIIHAWAPNRKVVECRLDEHFMALVRGCFRFPEVMQ